MKKEVSLPHPVKVYLMSNSVEQTKHVSSEKECDKDQKSECKDFNVKIS
jgi:hypothetical protein